MNNEKQIEKRDDAILRLFSFFNFDPIVRC